MNLKGVLSPYVESRGMKEIKLSKGFSAIVDDEDYERVSSHRWVANENWRTVYGVTYGKSNGKPTITYLHRLITNAPKGLQVDHIDGNGLNCQKLNLRLATPKQNSANRQKGLKNSRGATPSSQHLGVCWDNSRQRWMAYIRRGEKRLRRVFRTEAEARSWRESMARQLDGDFISRAQR